MSSIEQNFSGIFPASSDVFDPYIVMDERANYIHLSVTKFRKVLFIFTFNIIPLIILGLLFPLVVYSYNMPELMRILFSLCAIVIALIFLFKKVIHEVKISDTTIEIKGVRFFTRSLQVVPVDRVLDIYLSVVYGRGGGAFFKLNMKDGYKIEFLVIPLMIMSKKRLPGICKRLKEITGLNIQGNLLAHGMIGEVMDY